MKWIKLMFKIKRVFKRTVKKMIWFTLLMTALYSYFFVGETVCQKLTLVAKARVNYLAGDEMFYIVFALPMVFIALTTLWSMILPFLKEKIRGL